MNMGGRRARRKKGEKMKDGGKWTKVWGKMDEGEERENYNERRKRKMKKGKGRKNEKGHETGRNVREKERR